MFRDISVTTQSANLRVVQTEPCPIVKSEKKIYYRDHRKLIIIEDMKTKSVRKSSNFSLERTKPCTRIIFGILPSILHFLKPKDISNWLT